MSTQPPNGIEWPAVDRRAVGTARLPAADAVRRAGDGRPGTAMSPAPVAYTIFRGRRTCCSSPTGSEVRLAVAAREAPEGGGTGARVVSMPSMEWFEGQPRECRDSVLPPSVKARVAVEAGVGLTWRRFVGDAGRLAPLERFGASADAGTLFAAHGFTAGNVAGAAGESPAAARG